MQTQTQTRAIGTGASAVGGRSGALTRGQLATVIILGLIFWFLGAMSVLFGSPAGFFGPTASVVAFALGIPICWISVLVIKKLARLETGQTLPGIAIGLAAATFCDGIALTWVRGLYGSDPAQVTYGAAWILWGAGLFLLFAYLEDYRQVRETR